jgi:hypothetical protein
MAIVCLHISAVLYVLVGLAMAAMMAMVEGDDIARYAIGGTMFVFCLALAVGIEFVVSGLKRRKFWAWVAGLAIFAMYLPSAFLPLGAFGMWGLLDGGSQREFGMSRTLDALGPADRLPAG